jgi:hypothetical protein
MTVDRHLHEALACLERDNWEAAHQIVQGDDTAAGCWIHGIVHVMEGDLDNARYWYGRAGRAFTQDAAQEIAAVKKSLK